MSYSTCISDPDYSQYECQAKYMRDRLKKAKCLWPFQIYNKFNTEKDICVNMTDFDGKCGVCMCLCGFNDAIILTSLF